MSRNVDFIYAQALSAEIFAACALKKMNGVMTARIT